MNRETVTVTVLFIAPALVTIPFNAIGGIAQKQVSICVTAS